VASGRPDRRQRATRETRSGLRGALSPRPTASRSTVAAPSSTFDLTLETVLDPHRAAATRRKSPTAFGRATAPEGIRSTNPPFDVTPAELIAGSSPSGGSSAGEYQTSPSPRGLPAGAKDYRSSRTSTSPTDPSPKRAESMLATRLLHPPRTTPPRQGQADQLGQTHLTATRRALFAVGELAADLDRPVNDQTSTSPSTSSPPTRPTTTSTRTPPAPQVHRRIQGRLAKVRVFDSIVDESSVDPRMRRVSG